jgi:two-component system response regulator AtoC
MAGWRQSPSQAALTGEPMSESDRRSIGSAANVPDLRVVHRTRTLRPHRASFGPSAEVIGRIAETDVTVLLRGERGTGKELVARGIHDASARRDHPFVKIDCAAPPQVLEPELFGCERGAVAGAGHHRPGRLEFAHQGTLFLDHVSELPPALQLRFQRLLEDGGFVRAGAREAVRANVRVIAASDLDLERGVTEGRFREALFFRLNVLCLTLPPLRQRRAELPELTEFFLRQYATHYNKPEVTLSPETLRLFGEYAWPANLQELESIIKRIVMLGDDRPVREELTRSIEESGQLRGKEPEPVGPASPPAGTGRPASASPSQTAPLPLKEIARQAADDAERELIFKTLQQTRWNRREAAQMLGVSYKALLYKIKRAEPEGAS